MKIEYNIIGGRKLYSYGTSYKAINFRRNYTFFSFDLKKFSNEFGVFLRKIKRNNKIVAMT